MLLLLQQAKQIRTKFLLTDARIIVEHTNLLPWEATLKHGVQCLLGTLKGRAGHKDTLVSNKLSQASACFTSLLIALGS